MENIKVITTEDIIISKNTTNDIIERLEEYNENLKIMLPITKAHEIEYTDKLIKRLREKLT